MNYFIYFTKFHVLITNWNLQSCSWSILVTATGLSFAFSDRPFSSWLTHVCSNPPTASFCSCPVQFFYLNTVWFGQLHFPSSFLQLQEAVELQLPHWSSCSELLALWIFFWLASSYKVLVICSYLSFYFSDFVSSFSVSSKFSLLSSSFCASCCLSLSPSVSLCFSLSWMAFFLNSSSFSFLRAFFPYALCASLVAWRSSLVMWTFEWLSKQFHMIFDGSQTIHFHITREAPSGVTVFLFAERLRSTSALHELGTWLLTSFWRIEYLNLPWWDFSWKTIPPIMIYSLFYTIYVICNNSFSHVHLPRICNQCHFL